MRVRFEISFRFKFRAEIKVIVCFRLRKFKVKSFRFQMLRIFFHKKTILFKLFKIKKSSFLIKLFLCGCSSIHTVSGLVSSR